MRTLAWLLVVAVGGLAHSASAQSAPERGRFAWARSEGADDCIDQATLMREVALSVDRVRRMLQRVRSSGP
jgi:hypothetical protein